MSAETGSATEVAAPIKGRAGWVLLSVTRILIGFTFLWAFLDKTFGLGFSTCRDRESGAITLNCDASWINGGRITEGYLGSSSGPLKDFFVSLGSQPWTDWAFMIGLAGVGLALILGIGTRIAAVGGAALLAMMYVSHAWPGQGGNTTNPFVDDHMINAVAIFAIVILEIHFVQKIGLGEKWKKLEIVKKNRWLI
ncbi:DoxX family membrane protein [Demequina aurantiaca]|uniref:DoxX family membrane protein n=1 Tax=Demequina aurantiaca TaxID=676200 RepID=UPI0007824383|nr:DoxX family membrane protein [Demequina aurantiaca]